MSEKKTKSPIIHEVACVHCGKTNELPYLFCDQCDQPRLKIGRMTVFFNLWIAMGAFFATFYWQELLDWAWPLYLFYTAIFFQFTMALTRGRKLESARLSTWLLVILGSIGIMYHVVQTWGSLFFVITLREWPNVAEREPMIFYPIATSILVLVGLPLYFRWKRLFGWANAYRIIVLSALVAALSIIAGLQLLEWSHGRVPMPALEPQLTDFLDNTKKKYDYVFGMLAVSLIRIFLFEIFVFAAVRGYTSTKKIEKRPPPPGLARETALVRSTYVLAMGLTRIYQVMENMMGYLLGTLVELLGDLSRVIVAFLREIFIPIVSLLIAGILLIQFTELTMDYVAENAIWRLAIMGALVMGLMMTEMVFLSCKTTYRVKGIVSFHGQLISWLLPNLLIFFLLLSLSLAGTSSLLNQHADEEGGRHLPFFVGLLTKSLAVFLVLIVGVILIRKRSLLIDPARETIQKGKMREELMEREEALVEAMEEGSLDEEELSKEPVAVEQEVEVADEAVDENDPVAVFRARKKRERAAWDVGIVPPSKNKPNIVDEKKGILGSAKGVFSKLGLKEKAGVAAVKLNDRVSGKPENVRKFLEINSVYTERTKQLNALHQTRAQITEETFQGLEAKYQTELNGLEKQMRSLQKEIDSEYGDLLFKKNQTEQKLNQLGKKSEELSALKKAGAIEESDYLKQATMLNMEQEKALKEERQLEKKMGYLSECTTQKS